MKLLCFEATDDEIAYCTKALSGVDVVYFDEKLQDRPKPDAEAEIISVFVGSTVTKESLKLFPKLKYIVTRSTGYDHIDLKGCAARNVRVCNVPSYGEHTVAEFTMGLLLSLSRKLYDGIDRLKETGSFSYEGLQGFDLRDRTLGVVGTGRIGRHVVRMAKGFSMNVIAYDPFPSADLAKDEGFTYVTLDELLKQSDIVTLHVPYMKETHHLMNAKRFAKMKTGALLINVSRGGLVDTDALLAVLKNETLGGAALDVLEEEGAIKDEFTFLRDGHPASAVLKTVLENHELMRLPNVLITPHMAFNTREGVERIIKTTSENIQAIVKGKPQNLVSK